MRSRDPLAVAAPTFNRAAERYYRQTLRQRHIREAVAMLREECSANESLWNQLWAEAAPVESRHLHPLKLLDAVERALVDDGVEPAHLLAAINLLIALVHSESPSTDLDSPAAQTIAAGQEQVPA